MPNKESEIDLGIMDDSNYAVIEGKKYPIKFIGYDQNTYNHSIGCLAHNNMQGCCQCGALDKTAKLYGVYCKNDL